MSRGAGSMAGLTCFAGEAARGVAPQVEIGLAELRLQFGRAGLVRQPVFGDDAEGLDQLGELVRRVVARLGIFTRFEVSGERPAAVLHRAREIHRERVGVEPGCGLGLGR